MNIPTLIVLAIVAAVFIGIIVKTIVDKKKGKSSCSCGCSCSGCSMSEICHQPKQ
ncbi:MAG: FeoB-associated Cys-rich membrane protein [Clostridia bacterium]|nr:FeoB-associated Cys-rich membrane protein [Clostridia bacterium]